MRLDKYLVENNYVESRNRASILLEKNQVLVNGKPQKPSYDVKELDKVEIVDTLKYVSMGGYKLEKAILDFNISLKNKICVDIGCSKGGFTQCLLKNGAKKVYAVDVTIAELDSSLAENPLVYTKEINAKDLNKDTIKDEIDFVCVDCSFISIKNIIDNIMDILKIGGEAVILLKPQFECGAINLTKKGIVKNKSVLSKVCLDFYNYFISKNISILNFTTAPIRANKNIEFLFHLSNTGNNLNFYIIEGILKNL